MKVSPQDILVDIRNADIPDIDVDSMNIDESFSAQGIDSLDAMSLFLCIEEKYGFKIPDEDIDNLNSISDLAKYVSDRV